MKIDGFALQRSCSVKREVCSSLSWLVASAVQNEASPRLFSHFLWIPFSCPLGPRFSSAAAAQHTSLPLAPSPWSAPQSLPACLRRWKRTAQLLCSPLRSLQTHLQVKHSLITWCKSVKGRWALSQLSACSVNTRTWVCLPATLWKTDMAAHAWNTSAMEAEAEGSLELTGQTDPLDWQWQTLSQKIRWKSDKGRQQALICSLRKHWNTHTPAYTHAPIHTH